MTDFDKLSIDSIDLAFNALADFRAAARALQGGDK
jgi:hypothetical protein